MHGQPEPARLTNEDIRQLSDLAILERITSASRLIQNERSAWDWYDLPPAVRAHVQNVGQLAWRPRWNAGRRPFLISVQVWQTDKTGYRPVGWRYGYLAKTEMGRLLGILHGLTTPSITPPVLDRTSLDGPAT